MCPACIASAAWVVGSAVSTGGVTALVVRTFGKNKKSTTKNDSANSEQRSNDHGYTHDESGDGENRSV
jgi:hypothetical protein